MSTQKSRAQGATACCLSLVLFCFEQSSRCNLDTCDMRERLSSPIAAMAVRLRPSLLGNLPPASKPQSDPARLHLLSSNGSSGRSATKRVPQHVSAGSRLRCSAALHRQQAKRENQRGLAGLFSLTRNPHRKQQKPRV